MQTAYQQGEKNKKILCCWIGGRFGRFRVDRAGILVPDFVTKIVIFKRRYGVGLRGGALETL